MTDTVYLDQAVRCSKELTRMRSRGPGDVENAMRAIEKDYGLDYWLLYSLRYRVERIKDIGIGAYVRLRSAYQTECERQRRHYEHEQEITKAKGRIAETFIGAADALAGTEDGSD